MIRLQLSMAAALVALTASTGFAQAPFAKAPVASEPATDAPAVRSIQTLAPRVIRAQSPFAGAPQVQPAGGYHHAGGPLYAHHQEHLGMAYEHFEGTHVQRGAEPTIYPQASMGHGGYCPQGDMCPPQYGGQQCQGNCPLSVHHHHTYAVRTPSNLSYPPQGAPGGVIVPPYYTHKGPSDFFMK